MSVATAGRTSLRQALADHVSLTRPGIIALLDATALTRHGGRSARDRFAAVALTAQGARSRYAQYLRDRGIVRGDRTQCFQAAGRDQLRLAQITGATLRIDPAPIAAASAVAIEAGL